MNKLEFEERFLTFKKICERLVKQNKGGIEKSKVVL